MASELRVDKIHNEGGDNDSGINLATNDSIKFDIAGSTKAEVDSSGHAKIDTIKGYTSAASVSGVGEGGTNTTNLQNGLCKAWVNADNDASRNDSFNFDGRPDHGTGDFSYDLIAHMSATNSYSQSGLTRGTADSRIVTRNTSRDTAGVVAIEIGNDESTLVDMHHDIQIVGDLA